MTSGEDGGAPFITDGEHKTMQHACQTHILSEVMHNEDKLVAVHDTLVDFKKCHDEKHEATIRAITRLETKLDELISDRQKQFTCMLPLLYSYIVLQGYSFTLGDAYRDKRCPYGHPMSLHRFRLAQDINLFDKDGNYIKSTEGHKQFGEFWEYIGGTWGGRFNDGNHYSLAWRGMK